MMFGADNAVSLFIFVKNGAFPLGNRKKECNFVVDMEAMQHIHRRRYDCLLLVWRFAVFKGDALGYMTELHRK